MIMRLSGGVYRAECLRGDVRGVRARRGTAVKAFECKALYARRSLKVKVFIKAANACGNNEGGIPGGNKRRSIARLRAFCGDHRSIALKAMKRLVDRCERRVIEKRRSADQGRVRVWCGGARQEKRLFGLYVKISKRFDKFESRAFGLARGKKRVKVLLAR